MIDLDRVLHRVAKPARYTGGEWNSIVKDWESTEIKMVVSYPDLYEIGIEVNQLIFQNVDPPDPVKPSFNEVNESQQQKERKINEAWSEYNQEIPKAEGEAEQMIRAAEGYAMARVNNAEGDAKRFKSVYREYARAPLVTRKRLYLEAILEILPKVDKKIIFDENLKNLLPLLNLNKEVIK